MKSSASCLVRLATDLTTRSSQSSSYGNEGMSLMWIPAHTTTAAFRARPQRRGDERADRREQDRGVELLRRRPGRVACPLDAELERERLRRLVLRAREREHAPALVPRDLRDDVRRGAEAVEPEPLGVAGHAQRAVADQPGAEERRRLLVGVALRNRHAVALVGDGELRVAAVQVVAGEARAVAEVLASAQAVPALVVGPAEPRDADPVARREALAAEDDASDDLVTDDERELRVRQLAVDDVQVRAADAAREDLDEHLSRAGLGIGKIGRAERPPGFVQHHCPHARG